MTSAKMVLNEMYDDDWETTLSLCLINSEYDVRTVAMHEFGRFGGWLNHSTSSADIMHGGEYDGCQRSLSDDDEDNMNDQYSGH